MDKKNLLRNERIFLVNGAMCGKRTDGGNGIAALNFLRISLDNRRPAWYNGTRPHPTQPDRVRVQKRKPNQQIRVSFLGK